MAAPSHDNELLELHLLMLIAPRVPPGRATRSGIGVLGLGVRGALGARHAERIVDAGWSQLELQESFGFHRQRSITAYLKIVPAQWETSGVPGVGGSLGGPWAVLGGPLPPPPGFRQIPM